MEHISVLQQEVLHVLAPKPGQNFIDCTLGYGGHAKLILEKTSPNGKLLGIDQDDEALVAAKDTLKDYSDRVTFQKANFTELGLLIRKWPVEQVNGILIDLGASTPQLTGARGFSFRQDAPLDMRMNPQTGTETAAEIINNKTEKELVQILQSGEERFARQIAKRIVIERQKQPIDRTLQLVEVVKKATPPSYRFSQKTHFATGTFRALRIAVNNELESLKNVLPQAVQVLSSGAVIAIISFHSLEDRIVKNFFRDAGLEIITSKPIEASAEEISINPSSRSAKLRAARKI